MPIQQRLHGNPHGKLDILVAKFNPSGILNWFAAIGTSEDDVSNAAAANLSADFYFTGYTRGDLSATNAGGRDIFLIKFNGSGSQLFAKQLGTTGDDEAHGITVDTNGNVLIAGQTTGNLGGPSAGNADAFLQKFDSSGNLLWTRQIGTALDDKAFSVATDLFGNIFVAGATDGNLDGLGPFGNHDIFVSKFDSAGTLIWSKQLGTSLNDEAYGITVDPAGDIYVGGYTNGDLGSSNLGGSDALLIKLSPVPEPPTFALLGIASIAFVLQSRRLTAGLSRSFVIKRVRFWAKQC